MKTLKIVLIASFLVLALGACEEKGTFEKAGEKMDEAMKDAGNAIEDACEDAKKAAGAEDEDC
jgi:hypothetical protein